MISRLEVKWFKSIRHLVMECRRVNVFIGEPNTGKSNIIEVIGLLSHLARSQPLREFVRMRDMTDLFHNKDTLRSIEVTAGDKHVKIHKRGDMFVAEVFTDGKQLYAHSYKYDGSFINPAAYGGFKEFKMYRFRVRERFEKLPIDYLEPPDGRNLLSLLLSNAELRRVFRDILSNYGFKLNIREFEGVIEVIRELEDGVLVALPLHVISETLYKLLMHLAAVMTNKGSVIAFEEPEVHTYPYYTKYLAERIARDRSNQYFITTHSPYILLPLLEKTPLEELTVNIVYMEKGETKVKQLQKDEVERILDLEYEALLNLDKFIKRVGAR